MDKDDKNSPCPGAGDVAWLQPPLYELLASVNRRRDADKSINLR